MVDRGQQGAAQPAREPGSGRAALGRIWAAPSQFLGLLPALLLALLCLRAAELGAGWPAGTAAAGIASGVGRALADDALALLRHLPLLLLLSLPALLVPSRGALYCSLGLLWSVVIVAQACLVEYFIVARVPLGADLYAYSLLELKEVAAVGPRPHPLVVVGTVVALLSLWLALARLVRSSRTELPAGAVAMVFALSFAALAFGPAELPPAPAEAEYARSLRLNKAASFVDSSLVYLMHSRAPGIARSVTATGSAAAVPILGFRYLDPRYPFLHAEQTPDALGAHFATDRPTPPNFVFLIVEGLGRSFSGPQASLGSFTPFLDELAGKSLYWDNFLAVQGRTFGVLPSVFGSLPFGDQGFAALHSKLPEHVTLLSVLKAQGYRLRFFSGTDLNFDDERAFLERQGVDALFDRKDIGVGRAPTSEWGYDDDELVSFALAQQARDPRQPYLDVLQTVTMHEPYRFPGQQRYERLFEQRLSQLGVAEWQRSSYRAYRDIYTSILYTDDALRRYFEEARKSPYYGNTIFIVTGDHRLPEIPMAEWIDRYHVPLIIYSPLLKAPLRIKSVSSDFDIAPSLLAFLSHCYGMRTPPAVAWIGSGLDLEPSFRSVHEFPLKQTKANLVDFVAGPWLLSRDALYLLRDGMQLQPLQDGPALARAEQRFAAFRSANAEFARTLALLPRGAATLAAPYAERDRQLLGPMQAPPGVALAVQEVRAPEHARAGHLAIDVVFGNAAAQTSGMFVPLVVLLSADGREVSESYGRASTVAAGQAITLHLSVKTDGVPAGRYYLSVFPSDPATGKRTGEGRFRIPIVIDA
jgi:phosphoglycerol transferase MdoB-like AlkP superfamily enzyme